MPSKSPEWRTKLPQRLITHPHRLTASSTLLTTAYQQFFLYLFASFLCASFTSHNVVTVYPVFTRLSCPSSSLPDYSKWLVDFVLHLPMLIKQTYQEQYTIPSFTETRLGYRFPTVCTGCESPRIFNPTEFTPGSILQNLVCRKFGQKFRVLKIWTEKFVLGYTLILVSISISNTSLGT